MYLALVLRCKLGHVVSANDQLGTGSNLFGAASTLGLLYCFKIIGNEEAEDTLFYDILFFEVVKETFISMIKSWR